MAFPTMITVNGTLKKVDGTPEKGHIVFQAPTNVLSSTDATVIVPSYKVVTLDASGAFSVSLPASNDPSWNPNNWTYRVSEQLTSGKRDYRTIVPYDAVGGQFDYPDLVPAIDVDAQLYALYNHVHSGGGGTGVTWDEITGKPTTFPPSAHNHDDRYYTESEVTAFLATKENVGVAAGLVTAHNSATTSVHGIADTAALATESYVTSAISAIDYPVDSVAGKTGTVTLVKGDVGLGNVDNTADTAKPVSTAQQTALNLKVDKTAYPGLLVLNVGDPVPGGTASGTVIVRI